MKNLIKLVVFSALMPGAGFSKAQNVARDYSIQREWMLVSFGKFTKNDLVRNEAGIDLTAPQKKGAIMGSAFMGCNKMSFTSSFNKQGSVKFSKLASTKMACDKMDIESAFRKTFEKMTRYSVKGHELTLSDNKGNKMKFIAKDWD